jgi:hypothetical protein
MKDGNEQLGAWKGRFAGINAYVSEHGGWMVSVPGDREMHFLAPPGSPLPHELRELGYIVERIGETQRIAAKKLRVEIVEMFDLRVPPDAAAGAPIPGASKPQR